MNYKFLLCILLLIFLAQSISYAEEDNLPTNDSLLEDNFFQQDDAYIIPDEQKVQVDQDRKKNTEKNTEKESSGGFFSFFTSLFGFGAKEGDSGDSSSLIEQGQSIDEKDVKVVDQQEESKEQTKQEADILSPKMPLTGVQPQKAKEDKKSDDKKPTKISNSIRKLDDSNDPMVVAKKNKAIREYLNLLESSDQFGIDQLIDYYGLDLLILKVNVQRDLQGHALYIRDENTEEQFKFVDYTQDPDYFLSLEKNRIKTREIRDSKLYEYHKALLSQLVDKVPDDKQSIVLIYVRGNDLYSGVTDSLKLERSIYTQYVIDYLLKTKQKIKIEKRYVSYIPEDEIFMLIAEYQGNIKPNLYNSDDGDIIQWLARYKNLEKQRLKLAKQNKKDFETFLSNTDNSDHIKKLTELIDEETNKTVSKDDVNPASNLKDYSGGSSLQENKEDPVIESKPIQRGQSRAVSN